VVSEIVDRLADPVFNSQHDRRKVTDWVYEELRTAILDLRLPPGSPLREATLANQLGVSKTPVREAIMRLEQEGLAEAQSFRGAVVSGYSRSDLIEIYEVRELLEGAAVRDATLSMQDADRKALAKLMEESKRLLAESDSDQLVKAITEFDTFFYERIKNSRIQAMIGNIQAHLTRIGLLTAVIPGRIAASVSEHARIVEAVLARDPEAAALYMRDHIRSVRDAQVGSLDAAGQ
jgi:DNA-binding GntR family transcriptional regulator